MSDCCSKPKTETLPNQSQGSDECPRCGARGRPVDIVTLKSLLNPEAMRRLDVGAQYRFCRTADCPVVYFGDSTAFNKGDVLVPVFQKESGGSTPVCYCFGYTTEAIAGAVNDSGKSAAVAQITEYVAAGNCACEIRNPQGSCCLGNVSQVFRRSTQERAETVATTS